MKKPLAAVPFFALLVFASLSHAAEPYFRNICVVDQTTVIDDPPMEMWIFHLATTADRLSIGRQVLIDNGNGTWTQMGTIMFPNGTHWACAKHLTVQHRGSWFGKRYVVLQDRYVAEIEYLIFDDGGRFQLYCRHSDSTWLSGNWELIAQGWWAWYNGL